MKTITMKTLSTGLVALTLLFTACKKDPGPAGAAGPQGPAGNANVTSYSASTTSSNWAFTAPSWVCTVTLSQLTQDILDNGAMLGYLSDGAGGWQPLPKVSFISSTLQSKIQCDFVLGQIKLYYTYSDYSTPPVPTNLNFKFVLLPHQMKKPNINYDNYNEVKAAYSLKD